MAYLIDEKNLERQALLASILQPWTIDMLKNIQLLPGSKVLDLGCGLGDTTALLAEQFADVHVTGVDKDAALIEEARGRRAGTSNLAFQTADVLQLPFENESFDFVFLRFLLLHIEEPAQVLAEIKRVCKNGARVMAIEPDFSLLESYPQSDAYPKMRQLYQGFFTDALMGRKLLSVFKEAEIQERASIIGMYPHVADTRIKKLYTLTGEALEQPILAHKVMTPEEYKGWVLELKRIEADDDCIIITNPSIAVWGTVQKN